MSSAKPPLELHAEIITADGLAQYRWDANDRDPGNRPQGMSHSNTLMNGHANASCALARAVSGDYPDLGILDTILFVGVDGQVAYEGRGSRFPRERSTTDRISAEAVGWIAHARDQPIAFLGIDQDIHSWGQGTAALQAVLQAAGYAVKGPGAVLADNTLSQSFDGEWPAGELPLCQAWFDAGPGQAIGSITYSSTPGLNVSEADTNWYWALTAVDDTLGNGPVATGDLQGAADNSGTLVVTVPGKRYAHAQFNYEAAGGVDGLQFNVDWTLLRVVGNHGIALVNGGLRASDIIRYTAQIAAPLLDTTSVTPSTHPIEQFAHRDLADPYDLWLLANAYERRNIAVWDNRRLTYEPLPDPRATQMTDWVLRDDDRNNLRRGYDGPTVDGQRNGAIVRFDNILTGAADLIDPTTHPELADTNTRLAANRAGIRSWQPIQLQHPNTPAGAARIAVAALAEFNRQRTPGRFQVSGHVRDAAGNWHQGWRPRAGETVLLEEDEDDPVRVIHEVSWAHDSRELTVNCDAASKTIDAILADMSV